MRRGRGGGREGEREVEVKGEHGEYRHKYRAIERSRPLHYMLHTLPLCSNGSNVNPDVMRCATCDVCYL